MKNRWLIEVYKVPDVKERADGCIDDISEQTEEQLDRNLHFQYQIQGNELYEVVSEINKKL